MCIRDRSRAALRGESNAAIVDAGLFWGDGAYAKVHKLVRILEVAVGVVLQIVTQVIQVIGHQLVCLPYRPERHCEVRVVEGFWFGPRPLEADHRPLIPAPKHDPVLAHDGSGLSSLESSE